MSAGTRIYDRIKRAVTISGTNSPEGNPTAPVLVAAAYNKDRPHSPTIRSDKSFVILVEPEFRVSYI